MNSTNQPAGQGQEKILSEFEPHTYEQWREAAEALLKGRPFDKIMLTPTLEDITLRPIYRRQDLEGLPHLGQTPGFSDRVRSSQPEGYLSNGWAVSQELPYGLPEEFNKIALHDLMRGQTELNIPLDLATRAGEDPDSAAEGRVGACGLSLANLPDLEVALKDVCVEAVSSYFRAGSSGLPVAALFFALAKKRGVALSELKGCIEIDPVASLVRLGKISLSLEEAFREMALLTAYAAENAPQMQTIGVQGTPYSDGGASAVEELAFVIATGVQYLREMQQRGLAPDVVAPRMRFELSLGSDFFMTIAKFRSARVLWTQVLENFGVAEENRTMYVHARTSLFNKTVRDPFANMLRTTTEAFSGVVGGANGMHVGPYDETFQVPDEFSRRIARNQQIILMEECEMTRTVDPAGGSWFVESLTDELGKKAWELFTEVEGKGGIIKALEAGLPQERVAAKRAKKAKLVAQRRDVIVGANMYPNAQEKLAQPRIPDYKAIFEKRSKAVAAYRTGADSTASTAVMDKLNSLMEASDASLVAAAVEAAAAGASIGELSRTIRKDMGAAASIPARIELLRAASEYEALRDAADAFESKTGKKPEIFQANYGPSRAYRIRADWTTAFFQTAGFAVANDVDFDDVDSVVKAFAQSDARIVVITSTDDTYVEAVPALAKALKAAHPDACVLVAGAAGDNEAAWKEAGVDDFVNARVNNYEMNRKLLVKAGVLDA